MESRGCLRNVWQAVWPRMPTALAMGMGLVFAFAGLAKMRQPYDFLRTVYAYEIIGPPLGRWVAMLLPPVEVALGVAMIAGLGRRGALLTTGVLLLAFLAAQGWVVLGQLDVECACFGSWGEETIGASTLLRTAVLAAAAFVTYALLRPRLTCPLPPATT